MAQKKRQPPTKRPAGAKPTTSGTPAPTAPADQTVMVTVTTGAPVPATATKDKPAPGKGKPGGANDSPTPKPRPGRPLVEREELGPLDYFTLAASFLVFVAYLPNIYDYYRVPRLALLAMVMGPGLVLLGIRAAKRDLAAIAGTAFLLWALLATILTDEPRNALWGVFSDASLYALAAYLAFWSLGRELSPKGRHYLPMTLIAGVSVTAMAGLAESIGDLGKLVPTGFPDRASGLTGNPVILGGVMVGGVALLIGWLDVWDKARTRRVDELPYRWLVLLAGFVGVLNLTGSRIALYAGILIAVVSLFRLRLPLAIAAGIAIGVGLFFSLAVPATQGSSSTARAGEGGGITPRVEAWKAGVQGVEERPVVGWGPGRYQAAASPHLTEQFPLTEGLNKVFTAAHNILIEMLIGGGVIGFVLFAAWVALAGLNARGPLLWCAIGIVLTLMLQPMSVMTVPFAVVALGAADPTTLATRVRPKTALLGGMGVLAAIGAIFGFLLVLSDYRLAQAIKKLDVKGVESAQSLRFTTSEFMGVKADVAIKRANATGQDADKTVAKEIASAAKDFDNYYPGWWNFHGAAQADWGDLDVAKDAFASSLRRFPWSEAALTGQLIVAQRQNDTATFAEADRKLCIINSPNCSTNLAQQQQQQQQQAQPQQPATP